MNYHNRGNYVAFESWGLYEMMCLRYHYDALNIIDDHKHPGDEPSSGELNEFKSKLNLPEELYRLLYRELYKIARNAVDLEAGVHQRRSFRRRVRKHRRTSDMAKRYYRALAVVKEMRDDVWQLNVENYEHENPFIAHGCNLCRSGCNCHSCHEDCTTCNEDLGGVVISYST